MNRLKERFRRLEAVEDEYRTAIRAIELLTERFVEDSRFLAADNLRFRDAARLVENLEATFIVRIFAEFEACLRNYWNHGLKRKTKPQTMDLIARVGARRSIPDDFIHRVQRVREFRNSLVHEDHEEVEALTLAEVKSRLCKYLSRLPLDW
jgi:hypothetical protein